MILRIFLSSFLILITFSAKSFAIPDLNEEGYLKLFLNKDDFSSPMRMVQDTRLQKQDPNDNAFGKYSGVYSGFAVWMGRSDSLLWRIVDIRWVFPDEHKASAYHRERLNYNCEKSPVIPKARLIGSESTVCGGELNLAGVNIVNYFYIFREKNVVVKLYAAQGSNVPGKNVKLKPSDLFPLAEKIDGKILGNSEGDVRQSEALRGPIRIRPNK